jgi:RND family efflux transporter MFP subunit
MIAAAAGLAVILAAALPTLQSDVPAEQAEIEPVVVSSDPHRRPPLRVRVAPVREGHIVRGGEVTGVVRAFRGATVSAETTGRVVERYVEPGDEVESGQALLLLDDTRLRLAAEQAQAKVAARKIDVKEAGLELARGEELVRGRTMSRSKREALGFAVERAKNGLLLAEVALKESERALAHATVRAPFAGSIETVHVDVGDYLAPGTPVTDLVDLSRARLQAGVTASEATELSAGSRATAIFEDLGGSVVSGEIRSIGRVADPASGTYRIEMWLDNPGGDLREGMVGRMRFPLRAEASRPIVPRSALVRREGRIALFVIEDTPDGPRASARSVRVGRNDGEQVEVLEGAARGERVVIEGLFALHDGARVHVEGDLAALPTATP